MDMLLALLAVLDSFFGGKQSGSVLDLELLLLLLDLGALEE